MNRIINFQEHQSRKITDITELNGIDSIATSLKLKGLPDDFMGAPKYLGLFADSETIVSSFYIGAIWLKENELATVVNPKINVDYLKMFSDALEVDSEKENNYFSKCYGIEFDKSEIELHSEFNIITPLILIHYISVLKNLTKHELKKGYIYYEENLKSKVKGHLLFQKHLRKNIIRKCENRAYCGFQEYTEDIAENRLLKKALIFASRAIDNYKSLTRQKTFDELKIAINQLFSAFTNVSNEIETHEIKSLRFNKLFANYPEAIKLAKMILRKYDYSLQKTEQAETKTLPFWIDMPRLYEMYVYKWLKENTDDEVLFQVEGYRGTAADFVLAKQGIVLDAKYKPHYKDSKRGIIDDIREMSGYARDEKILRHFENPKTAIVPCVILYPESFEEMKEFGADEGFETKTINQIHSGDESFDKSKGLLAQCQSIKAYRDFYKRKVNVPIIKE